MKKILIILTIIFCTFSVCLVSTRIPVIEEFKNTHEVVLINEDNNINDSTTIETSEEDSIIEEENIVKQNLKTVYTNTKVNLRSFPDTQSNIIDTLNINTEVKEIKKLSNNWSVVYYGEIQGYIFSKFLAEEKVTIISSRHEGKIRNNKKYLGKYKITAYCGCSKCCGKDNGITASGTKATQGRTIAAPSTFSFGKKLEINGHTYTVEDRGGAIKDKKIDMFFNSHSEALKWGVKYLDVYEIN